MVHCSKVSAGINRYIKDEILSKIETGSLKHLAMYGIGSLITMRVQFLTELLNTIPMFKFAQIVNGENVDIDLAIDIMRNYMREYDHFSIKIPGLIPGQESVLTLRSADVELLSKHIKEA